MVRICAILKDWNPRIRINKTMFEVTQRFKGYILLLWQYAVQLVSEFPPIQTQIITEQLFTVTTIDVEYMWILWQGKIVNLAC